MPTPEPRLPGVSTREAAIILGVSEATVRRMIAAGDLAAEKIARPGGTLLRVLIDTPEPFQEATEPRQAAPEAAQEQSRALDILDAVIRANAETMDKQAERIDRYSALLRQEMERRVRAEARADTMAERLTQTEAQLAAERAEAARARERRFRWWPWRG
jgi:excisionase family DNA binding protein